jgi:hypothetical protein
MVSPCTCLRHHNGTSFVCLLTKTFIYGLVLAAHKTRSNIQPIPRWLNNETHDEEGKSHSLFSDTTPVVVWADRGNEINLSQENCSQTLNPVSLELQAAMLTTGTRLSASNYYQYYGKKVSTKTWASEVFKFHRLQHSPTQVSATMSRLINHLCWVLSENWHDQPPTCFNCNPLLGI